MRLFFLLLVLAATPVMGAFKITVLSSDKPAIERVDVPADKPSIRLNNMGERTSDSGATDREVVRAALNPDPYAESAPLKEPMKVGEVEVADAPVKQSIDSKSVVVKDADVNSVSRYEMLQELKNSQSMGEVAQVDGQDVGIGIVDSGEPVRPLLEMERGQTFSDVLTKWATDGRYQVVFDLGVWERVKNLKMSVDYLFTTELKESVEQYLELLNNTPNLKGNNISLHACFYSNRFFKVTVGSDKCEVKV